MLDRLGVHQLPHTGGDAVDAWDDFVLQRRAVGNEDVVGQADSRYSRDRDAAPCDFGDNGCSLTPGVLLLFDDKQPRPLGDAFDNRVQIKRTKPSLILRCDGTHCLLDESASGGPAAADVAPAEEAAMAEVATGEAVVCLDIYTAQFALAERGRLPAALSQSNRSPAPLRAGAGRDRVRVLVGRQHSARVRRVRWVAGVHVRRARGCALSGRRHLVRGPGRGQSEHRDDERDEYSFPHMHLLIPGEGQVLAVL
jgi:hypothetical protein